MLRRVLSDTFAAIGARNRADHEQAMVALKDQGLRFLEPSPEARAEWVAAAIAARQEMIDSGAISAERYAALQAALRGYRAP